MVSGKLSTHTFMLQYVPSTCRSVPSTTSLVSVSSDDSGCEAGSDSEVQAASSPTNSVGGGGGRNGANVRFSFEEEEEEEEAEAEVETRSVKARAKSLINRVRHYSYTSKKARGLRKY